MMVPETRQRLEAALTDLVAYLVGSGCVLCEAAVNCY
jgi:hypothetical protein